MIMIENFKRILVLVCILFLLSCETFQDIAGLSKPDLENDLIQETPELVLPPDFDRLPNFEKPKYTEQYNQT